MPSKRVLDILSGRKRTAALFKLFEEMYSAQGGYLNILTFNKGYLTRTNPTGTVWVNKYRKRVPGIKLVKLRDYTIVEQFLDLADIMILESGQEVVKDEFLIVPFMRKQQMIGNIILASATRTDTGDLVKTATLHVYELLLKFRMRVAERAHEQSQVKNNFMANVSHEIRTPLNSIIGGIDYLRDLQFGKSASEMLEVMYNSSYTLLYLVNDILDIAGLESGKITLHLVPDNLATIMENCYSICKTRQSSDTAYCMQIDQNLPTTIITDPQRLTQVVMNLLSNAFKFTESGRVKLMISAADAETIRTLELPPIGSVNFDHPKYLRRGGIQEDKTGKRMYLKFTVFDTGIGIRNADCHKLFKSFSQIDSGTTKKYEGTGLGLAISHGFCRLMDGSIGFRSEYGKGSTFFFVVPVMEYHVERTLMDTSVLAGKLALIVDDKIDNIIRVSKILDRYGVKHYSCTAANHAIVSYVNNNLYQFDLGLIDVVMPNMDGNQLAEYISKHDNKFPLIALSSVDTKISNINGVFDAVLQKPYTETALINSMYNVLNSWDGTRSPRAFPKRSVPKLNLNPAASEINDNVHIEILLVEDNKNNQMTMRILLQSMGYYNLTIASNGKEAIKLVKKNKDVKYSKTDTGLYATKTVFKAILMDIVMPNMNGITTSIKLRELFTTDSQPYIIAITANAMPGDEEKCIRNGINAYLSKPINKKALALLLSKVAM